MTLRRSASQPGGREMWKLRQGLKLAAVAAVVVLGADAGGAVTNTPPATPTITEPSTDGQIVHPADVHMETSLFSDVDAGQTHVCSDFEIRIAATSELVWVDSCDAVNLVHVHLGDGSFVNSYAGRTELQYDTDYTLRARHKDSSGDPATEWSGWGVRQFRTATAPAPGTAVAWTLRQTGFAELSARLSSDSSPNAADEKLRG